MESDRLQSEITALVSQLAAKKERLNRIQNSCRHDWGQITYDPICETAYHIPSDIERGVYLGVDTIVSGVDVPAKTTRRWRRTCLLCGTVQTTQRTVKAHKSSGIEGCGCEVERPEF